MRSDEDERALEEGLIQQLERMGVRGQLSLAHDVAQLQGRERRQVPLTALRSRWPRLTPHQRSGALRRVAAQLSRGQSRTPFPLMTVLQALLIALSGAGAAGYLAYRAQGQHQSDGASELPAMEMRESRARQSCEQAEARIVRGGALGPTDMDGWVVELLLLGSAGEQGPASERLSAYLKAEAPAGYRLLTDPIAGSAGSGARVQVADAEVDSLRVTTLTFDNHYARSFARSREQTSWIRLAGEIFGADSALAGALYARCAHRTEPHAGVWFAGRDAPGALAALLSVMRGAGLASPAANWKELEPQLGRLSPTDIGTLLAPERAMLQRTANSVHLLFPFADNNRAARAARRLLDELSLKPAPAPTASEAADSLPPAPTGTGAEPRARPQVTGRPH